MSMLDDRRALHRIPELDNDLPKTMAYLRSALSGLRCTLESPIPGSLCAWFDFGAARTIAFRSDADALPIAERSAAPYASTHPGKMHACGHDGHMAMLLELARRVNNMATLDKNILLVFQPAEETTGGARDICESGILQRHGAEAIFGLHLWPDVPAGVVASRKNELLSRSCEINVDITGKSSHIARASEGIDALAAGVEVYRRVAAMEAALPPEVFRLCKFGKLESGTVRNAVSGHTRLEGTLRAYQDEVFFGLRDGLERICAEVAAETGCAITVTHSEGYPAVMNPPALYDRVKNECGIPFAEIEAPFMTTEDFAWYQQYLPGLFFLVGTGPSPALHADDFDFDERVMEKGAALLEQIARRY